MTFPSNPNDDDLHEAFGRKLRYRSGKWQVVSSPTVATVTEEAPKTEAVTQAVDLPMTGNEIGAMAYVQESNRLYIWNGSGWFEVALVNTNPTITAGGSATYELATDGTPTVVTLTANDPEGIPIAWSYSVTSGSLGGTTVSNVDNVFTITPSTDTNDSGTFQLTFTASDGVNVDTSASSFSLSFAWMGDDVLANITTEFTNRVIADTSTTDKIVIYGNTPGRMVYHELGSSSTIWRKTYTDFASWSSTNKYISVAFDANYIYHVFAGKQVSNQTYPGINVTKVSKTNGTIVGTAYNYQHSEVTSSFFDTVDCAVDNTNGLLYYVGMTNQSRMHVQALNIGDFSFNWARGKTLNTTGVINGTGAQNCLAVHDSKLAILSDQQSNGVVLEVLSSTGNYIGGVKLSTASSKTAESLYYYNGKYYCLFGVYNGSTYMHEAHVAVIDATTFSVLGNVKLRPNNTGYYSNYSNIYADSSGIYVGAMRYLMKLNHNLGAEGSWLTTSNGTSLVTPLAWSFNSGNFYFGFSSGTNFTVCGGPLDGSVFGTQFDTFNLVSNPFSVSNASTTSSHSGSYDNIGAQGKVTYNFAAITTTNYANYNVS